MVETYHFNTANSFNIKVTGNKGIMCLNLWGVGPDADINWYDSLDNNKHFKEKFLANVNQAKWDGMDELIILLHVEHTTEYKIINSLLPILTLFLDNLISKGLIKNYVTIRNNSCDINIDVKNHVCIDWSLCNNYIKHKFLKYDSYSWSPHKKGILVNHSRLFDPEVLVGLSLLKKHAPNNITQVLDLHELETSLENYDLNENDMLFINTILENFSSFDLFEDLTSYAKKHSVYLEKISRNNGTNLSPSPVNVNLLDICVEYSIEQSWDCPNWTSAAVFRPICAGYPFFVTSPHAKKHLVSKGFRLFDEIIERKPTECLSKISVHLDDIIDHAYSTVMQCTEFVNVCESKQHDILEIISHNKLLAEEIFSNTEEKINQLLLTPLSIIDVYFVFGCTQDSGTVKDLALP